MTNRPLKGVAMKQTIPQVLNIKISKSPILVEKPF